MNQKMDKLISFYKDKTITQEEKRTVAVKIVENMLASSSQEGTKTFIFEGNRYTNVGIETVYGLFKKEVKKNNSLKDRLNYETVINDSLLRSTQNELKTTQNELNALKKAYDKSKKNLTIKISIISLLLSSIIISLSLIF